MRIVPPVEGSASMACWTDLKSAEPAASTVSFERGADGAWGGCAADAVAASRTAQMTERGKNARRDFEAWRDGAVGERFTRAG